MKRSSTLRRRALSVIIIVVAILAALAAQAHWNSRADNAAAPAASHSAIAGLSSPSAFERANAVKALHVTKERAAAPALLNHLDDPDPEVGLYVAQALGDLATADTLPGLRAALHSDNPDVRWRAALALGRARDEKSVKDLAALLRDEDVLVERNAAEALAHIGGRAAADALAGALGSPLSSTTQVSMEALEGMGEAATPSLTLALNSSNALMRQNAATVLGYIASPKAIQALQLAAVDANPNVRSEAQWALDEISRAHGS